MANLYYGCHSWHGQPLGTQYTREGIGSIAVEQAAKSRSADEVGSTGKEVEAE